MPAICDKLARVISQRERLHLQARERTARMLALRKEGLLNYEIAERLGITHAAVDLALQRSRVARFGFEYLPSPYFARRARQRAAPGR